MKQVFRDMQRLAVRLARRNMLVESTRLLALTVQVSLILQPTTTKEIRRELLVMQDVLVGPNL